LARIIDGHAVTSARNQPERGISECAVKSLELSGVLAY
jgi:hypothetical protein